MYVCVSIGRMGPLLDDKCVYVNTVCFDVVLCVCFLIECEMYAPRAHLRKGALIPHCYYNTDDLGGDLCKTSSMIRLFNPFSLLSAHYFLLLSCE